MLRVEPAHRLHAVQLHTAERVSDPVVSYFQFYEVYFVYDFLQIYILKLVLVLQVLMEDFPFPLQVLELVELQDIHHLTPRHLLLLLQSINHNLHNPSKFRLGVVLHLLLLVLRSLVRVGAL